MPALRRAAPVQSRPARACSAGPACAWRWPESGANLSLNLPAIRENNSEIRAHQPRRLDHGGGRHVVFVKQGQRANGLEADLLLIDPAFVQPTAAATQPGAMALLRLEDWPVHFKMNADGLAAWIALAALLRARAQHLDIGRDR